MRLLAHVRLVANEIQSSARPDINNVLYDSDSVSGVAVAEQLDLTHNCVISRDLTKLSMSVKPPKPPKPPKRFVLKLGRRRTSESLNQSETRSDYSANNAFQIAPSHSLLSSSFCAPRASASLKSAPLCTFFSTTPTLSSRTTSPRAHSRAPHFWQRPTKHSHIDAFYGRLCVVVIGVHSQYYVSARRRTTLRP